MSLETYHKRRDFKKTSEPKGEILKPKNSRLFVVQKHAASHLHYDFRLELNGVLKSWAVPKGPCLDPNVKRLAMQVEDHPIQYANFEGIIPKGEYGGGSVIVWDNGTWQSEDPNPQAALHNGNLTFSLKGKKLKGSWKLIRDKKEPRRWLLFKLKDKHVRNIEEYDVTIKKPKSILSNKTVEQVGEAPQKIWTRKHGAQNAAPSLQIGHLNLSIGKMPELISPELATLVDEPPAGKEWLHEIKFDGYRLIIIKKKNKTKIFTRNQNDWTDRFTSIATAVNALPIENLILDGEVVVLDADQKPNFQLLQHSLKENKKTKFVYYAFDIIFYDKYNLTNLSLLERKNILSTLLKTSADKQLNYSDHVIGSGNEVFKKSCELGLEGIVSKNIYSTYSQKRTKDWLKIKCIKRQEFVIGGFTPPQGKRKYFGSLLLGTYNKKRELLYNGNVGTGFTETSLENIYAQLKKIQSSKMPFSQRPPQSSAAIWVKPELVCEVEFSEWTNDNHIRHPSFKGLRTDKPSSQILQEKELPVKKSGTKKLTRATNKTVITNPDKVLYPELKITKADLVEYYNFIESWMLPYVKNRPLTLVRCPEIYKKCFYQKHLNEQLPNHLFGVPIIEKNGSQEEYIYLKNINGLIALVQLGVLEIHPWGSSIKTVDSPDIIVFDLDPAEDVLWKEVVSAAKLIKKYLAELKLTSFVKSTGGKGLHIVLPIQPKLDWDTIKDFTHSLADFIVQQDPEKYVSTISKKARKGKIFIDYLRNQKGATAIAPYSTRARENATIATPLHWDELTNNIKDATFNIKTIYKRIDNLKKDPWDQFLKIKQKLPVK